MKLLFLQPVFEQKKNITVIDSTWKTLILY
jgi:hypothetical protein